MRRVLSFAGVLFSLVWSGAVQAVPGIPADINGSYRAEWLNEAEVLSEGRTTTTTRLFEPTSLFPPEKYISSAEVNRIEDIGNLRIQYDEASQAGVLTGGASENFDGTLERKFQTEVDEDNQAFGFVTETALEQTEGEVDGCKYTSFTNEGVSYFEEFEPLYEIRKGFDFDPATCGAYLEKLSKDLTLEPGGALLRILQAEGVYEAEKVSALTSLWISYGYDLLKTG